MINRLEERCGYVARILTCSRAVNAEVALHSVMTRHHGVKVLHASGEMSGRLPNSIIWSVSSPCFVRPQLFPDRYRSSWRELWRMRSCGAANSGRRACRPQGQIEIVGDSECAFECEGRELLDVEILMPEYSSCLTDSPGVIDISVGYGSIHELFK